MCSPSDGIYVDVPAIFHHVEQLIKQAPPGTRIMLSDVAQEAKSMMDQWWSELDDTERESALSCNDNKRDAWEARVLDQAAAAFKRYSKA